MSDDLAPHNFATIVNLINYKSEHPEDESILSATPFGPIFKFENITLRQALQINNTNRRFRLIGTFVPDELILLTDQRKKTVRYDLAAVLFIDFYDTFSLSEEFIYSRKGGATSYSKKIDWFLVIVIEQIYLNGGDLISFSDYGALSLWKAIPDESVRDLISRVISTCSVISDLIRNSEIECDKYIKTCIKSAISIGKVIFSIISGPSSQCYVLYGDPVVEVKNAVRRFATTNTIISNKVWRECIQTDYIVEKLDDQNFEVIKELKKGAIRNLSLLDLKKAARLCHSDPDMRKSSIRASIIAQKKEFLKKASIESFGILNAKSKSSHECVAMIQSLDRETQILHMRQILIETRKVLKVGLGLRDFINYPVLNKIENDLPLDRLTEIRSLTILVIYITLNESVTNLLEEVNRYFDIILTAIKHVGSIMRNDVTIEGYKVGFRVAFGLLTLLNDFNHCRFGIKSTYEILNNLLRLNTVSQVSASIATGSCICTTIGHLARRYYALIGAPIIKAQNMISLSKNTIICDTDTVIFSNLKKSHFDPLGYIDFRGIGKGYAFQFRDLNTENAAMNDLRFAYPILSRFHELEIFRDILDDIGLKDRLYAGILVEGNSRLGKSRLLDAFCALAKSRQIKVAKVAMSPYFVTKPYAVIFEVLKQILGLEDCKTIYEYQKYLVSKLGHIIPDSDMCYMNKLFCVRFQLSKQFIADSDWQRHKKCLGIFDKILKKFPGPCCFFIDNVQFMDYMSWQFLALSMNYKNIVLAMTLLETTAFEEMSRTEMDILKDKRLRRHVLGGLDLVSMPTLACQLMHVQGISPQVKNFLVNSEVTHPGWVEMLFSLINVINGLEFKTVTAEEAEKLGITCPQMISVSRIPLDVLPEDVTPPLERTNVPVCIATKNFSLAESFILYDIKSLGAEIYHRLNPYEQEVLQCASVLGRVFLTDYLEKILSDHQPMKTLKAIEKLMRIRVFECASLQRNPQNQGDPLSLVFESRATFSDMYHLLRCWCQNTTTSSEDESVKRYAYCRLLEFRIPAMQHIVYERTSDHQKKAFHIRIGKIFQQQAKKCMNCGGGPFLRIPGKRSPQKLIKKTKKIAFAKKDSDDKRDQSGESSATLSEIEVINFNQSTEDNRNIFSRRNTILQQSFIAQNIYDFDSTVVEGQKSKNIIARFIAKCSKKTKVHPISSKIDMIPVISSTAFSYIDFRLCRCLSIISCVFSSAYYHLKNHVEDSEQMVDFLLEYSAALIKNGEPSYALKFLAKADTKLTYVDRKNYQVWNDDPFYMKMIKKSLILTMRGNAFKLLGNYPQAKSNYLEAFSLFRANFSSNKFVVILKTLKKKLNYRMRWELTEHRSSTEKDYIDEKKNVIEQNSAATLRHVADIYMIFRRHHLASLASVKSLLTGFNSYDPESFADQAQLFISSVKVFGRSGDDSFIKTAEKCMLFAISLKKIWDKNEDVVMLGKVYAAMFQASMLQGNFLVGVLFGGKAIQIFKLFHMTHFEFKVLPLLVHLLVRIKRISEAMDMLQLLRDDAKEDIDKSAQAWYYAICMDLLLETGLLVETYETCASFAEKVLVSHVGFSINRDPTGLKRLVACLWMWQLRKGDLSSTMFVKSLNFFLGDFNSDDFAMILTICKLLECHLLLLLRCINMKKGAETEMLIADVLTIMDILTEVAKISDGVKPHFFLMKAYYAVLHGCYNEANSFLQKARNYAITSHNLMALSWILCNKKAWEAVDYNNMAHYWEENIGFKDTIVWQDLEMFDVNDWSNLLYSFPIPDSYL